MRFAALPLLSASVLTDPFQVAVVTAATTLPWLLLGLPVGAYVDRVDRIRLMVWADGVRTVALALVVGLLLGEEVGFAELLILALVLGTGEVMFDCASFAVLPDVVPAGRLETANGRLFTAQTVGRDLLGHLLGGLLYSVGRAIPLAVDALSFLVSAVLLRSIQIPSPAVETERKNLLREIAEGIRYIVRDRLLVTLTIGAGVINAVYLGQVAIFVLFVQGVLGLGPIGYGALVTAGAVGGVVGGVVADLLVRLLGRVAALLGSLVLIGCAGLGAFLGNVFTTAAGYALMGFGVMLWNVVTVALRQTLVPGRLLGRLIGAHRLVAWGMMPVGATLFGAVADLWGVRLAFGLGSLSIVVLALLVTPVLVGDARLSAPANTRAGDHG